MINNRKLIFILFFVFNNILNLLLAQTQQWKDFIGFDRISNIVPYDNSLWLAAESGILKINLVDMSIKKYTAVDGISVNKGQNAIAIASDGTVYAGGIYPGLNVLYPNSERWIKEYPTPSSTQYVEKMAIDKENNLWIADGNGIYEITNTGTENNIDTKGSYAVAIDSNNNIWFDYDKAILRIDSKGNRTVFNSSNINFPSSRITDIVVDPTNKVWVSSEQNGIACYDGNKWQIYSTSNSTLTSNYIPTIGILNNQYIIVGVTSVSDCTNDKLFKFDGNNFVLIPNSPFIENGEYITSMGWDKKGILYISSRRNNPFTAFQTPRLFSYNGNNFSEISIAQAESIPFSAEDRLAIDSSGNLWVASMLGGISRYDGKTWTHWDFTTDNLPISNFYNSIAVDHKGILWTSAADCSVNSRCNPGFFSGGISYYNEGKWTTLSSKFNGGSWDILVGLDNKKYFSDAISFFDTNQVQTNNFPIGSAIDNNGNIWFARNDTLFKYNDTNFTFYIIPQVGSVCSNMAIGSDNSIWFLTIDYAVNFINQVWKKFSFPYSLSNSWPTPYGLARLTVESSSKLWIATGGQGIVSFDTKTGNINNYNTDNSDIGMSYIQDILIDKYGNKWISNWNYEGTIDEFNENGIVMSIQQEKNNGNKIPSQYMLSQNYPNPFNPTTIINYSVPKTSLVTIKVYDILGREVATLVNEKKSAGLYSVQFNASSEFVSGVYFYKMQAGNFVETKKLLLIK